jgi:hypothetical protein
VAAEQPSHKTCSPPLPAGEDLQGARQLRTHPDFERIPISCVLAATTHRGIGQRAEHGAHRDRTEHGRGGPMPLLHRLDDRDHYPGERDQRQQPQRLPPPDRGQPDWQDPVK